MTGKKINNDNKENHDLVSRKELKALAKERSIAGNKKTI